MRNAASHWNWTKTFAIGAIVAVVLAATMAAMWEAPRPAEAQSEPAQVTGLTLTADSVTGFTASWTATSGAEEYAVEIATDSGFTANRTKYFTTATTFSFTALDAGTTYYVRVKAHSHDDVWVSNAAGDDLWRVNTEAPDSTTSPYGDQGSFPSGLTRSEGIEMVSSTEVLIVDSDSDSLWSVNPADPDDTTGDYGEVGDLVTTLVAPKGLARDSAGDLWVTEDPPSGGDNLYKINPADPDDTTGDYGLVGEMPSGITQTRAAAFAPDGTFYVVDTWDDQIWVVDTDDPDGSGSSLHCTVSGISSMGGMAIDSHGDAWVSNTNWQWDELWRLDLDDCSRSDDGYGDQGSFNSSLTGPASLSMIENADGEWSATRSLLVGTATAPGTPTITQSDGEVTLTWTAPTDTGGLTITDYDVRWRVSTPGAWVESASTGDNSTTYTYSTGTLVQGTSYQFGVRAVTSAGDGQWSDASAALTYVTPPDAPAAPTVVPGNNQLAVSWTAPTETGGLDVTDYDVRYTQYDLGGLATGDWDEVSASIGTDTSVTITGLIPGFDYDVQVRAENGNGEGDWSSSTEGTPSPPPDAPDAPTLAVGDQQITVSWDEPDDQGNDITDYDVEYRAGESGDWSERTHVGTGRTTTITGLENDTAYQVRVRATNAAGSSDWSSSSSATPVAGDPEISVSNATPTGGDTITLSFSPISEFPLVRFEQRDLSVGVGVTGEYKEITSVYVSSSAPAIRTGGSGGSITVTVGDDSGAGNETYRSCYRATTSDAWECGNIFTTPDIYGTANWSFGSLSDPPRVTGLSGSVTSTTVALSWTAVTNADEYHVRWKSGTQAFSTDVTVRTEVVTTNEATITGLTTDTAYDFRVLARRYGADADGLGLESATLTRTPTEAPGIPVGLSAVWDSADGEVDLTWTAPTGIAPDGYQIVRRNRHGAAYTTLADDTNSTATTYSDTSASSVTGISQWAYAVKARVLNAVGDASAEADVDVPQQSEPGKPAVSVSLESDSALMVEWSAPDNGGRDITDYDVRYKITTLSVWTALTHDGTARTAEITGLTNGEDYDVQVRATNGNGTGAWSTTASGAPTATLNLSHFDTTGLDVDALALITVGGTTTWYSVSPRPTESGSLTDGDLDLGSDDVAITQINRQATSLRIFDSDAAFSWTNYIASDEGEGMKVFLQTGPDLSTRVESSAIQTTGATAIRFTIAVPALAVNDLVIVAIARHLPPGKPDAPVVSPRPSALAVQWTAPTEQGFSDINDYDVEYRTTGGAWVDVPYSGTATMTTISSLTNGTEYEVRVRAKNAQAAGDWSDAASGTPSNLSVPDAPAAPTLTRADEALGVAWAAPADTGGSDITGYDVQYREGTSGTWQTLRHEGLTTSTTITGLINGEAYQVQVRAVNDHGNGLWSQASIETPSTTPGKPNVPSMDIYSTVLDLQWAPPADTGGSIITDYNVQYRETGAAGWVALTHDSDAPHAVITGLTEDTEYEAQVQARNANGVGPWSDSAVATTLGTGPAAPGLPTLTPRDEALGVAWNEPDGRGNAITDYNIQYRETGDVAWLTKQHDGRARTAEITGLTNGTEYDVRVQAVNSEGEGPWSGVSSAIPFGPPGAPAAPTLTAEDEALGVAWAAPADTNGNAISDYDIQYREGTTGEWETHRHEGVGLTSTITGLTNGVAYQVQVRAVNDAGPGEWSQATLGTPSTTPGAPAAPTLTPRSGQITVAWEPPGDTGGAIITDYDVQYRTTGAGTWTQATVDGLVFEVVVTGLTDTQSYEFQVRAENQHGDGAWSPSSTATPAGVPDAPSAPTIGIDDAQLSVTWTAPADNGSAITDYDIEYLGSDGQWKDWPHSGTGLTATILQLTNGQLYYVHVRAENAQGESEWSTSGSGTPAAEPDAPAAPTLTSANQGLGVEWQEPDDNGSRITDYDVQYKASSSSVWIDLQHVGVSRSANITGLTNGTAYDVQVRAENAEGESGWSPSATETARAVPDAPDAPTLTGGDESIAVAWDEPAGNGSAITGYEVQYRLSTSETWLNWPHTGAGRTADITGLTNGRLYYVRVRAENAAGFSAWSQSTQEQLVEAPSPPDPPTLTSRDESLEANWFEPVGMVGVTDYDVQYKAITSGTWLDVTHVGVSRSATITGLTNGTTYEVRVRAENAIGESEWSQPARAKPFRKPDAPNSPTLESVVGGLEVNWLAPDNGGSEITDYDVEYQVDGSTDWLSWPHDGASTSTIITDLTDQEDYDVRVRAENAAGDGDWSPTASALFNEIVPLGQGCQFTTPSLGVIPAGVTSSGPYKVCVPGTALLTVNDSNSRFDLWSSISGLSCSDLAELTFTSGCHQIGVLGCGAGATYNSSVTLTGTGIQPRTCVQSFGKSVSGAISSGKYYDNQPDWTPLESGLVMGKTRMSIVFNPTGDWRIWLPKAIAPWGGCAADHKAMTQTEAETLTLWPAVVRSGDNLMVEGCASTEPVQILAAPVTGLGQVPGVGVAVEGAFVQAAPEPVIDRNWLTVRLKQQIAVILFIVPLIVVPTIWGITKNPYIAGIATIVLLIIVSIVLRLPIWSYLSVVLAAAAAFVMGMLLQPK